MPSERKPPDPKAAAGNIAMGLMRFLTQSSDFRSAQYGMEELAWGIEEALRYLKGDGWGGDDPDV